MIYSFAKSLGEKRFMQFVRENRLDTPNIFDTIKKTKRQTFSSALKHFTIRSSRREDGQ
jgi:hypothetical protein